MKQAGLKKAYASIADAQKAIEVHFAEHVVTDLTALQVGKKYVLTLQKKRDEVLPYTAVNEQTARLYGDKKLYYFAPTMYATRDNKLTDTDGFLFDVYTPDGDEIVPLYYPNYFNLDIARNVAGALNAEIAQKIPYALAVDTATISPRTAKYIIGALDAEIHEQYVDILTAAKKAEKKPVKAAKAKKAEKKPAVKGTKNENKN